MVESYKFKSKLATAIGGIATIISTLGVEQLETLFPTYGRFIPAIVAFATWYVSQTTENKRVEVAEQIVHEEYDNDKVRQIDCFDNDAPVLNDEYVAGDSDGA